MIKIINSFVYQRVFENNLANPTIPAWLGETYTQCYEDIIIVSLLRAHIRRIGRPLNGLSYIEIGANHPVCTNSTYLLERKYGINGILVEANPKLIKDLQIFRGNNLVLHAAVCNKDISEVDFFVSPENEISSLNEEFVNSWKDLGVQERVSVPAIRINSLLEITKDIEAIILIIDCEGVDFDILKDIDFNKYRPLIIEIEPSDGFKPGTSTAIIEYLACKEYLVIAETDVNLIFLSVGRS
jgi:FkbM family methyltransferase